MASGAGAYPGTELAGKGHFARRGKKFFRHRQAGLPFRDFLGARPPLFGIVGGLAFGGQWPAGGALSLSLESETANCACGGVPPIDVKWRHCRSRSIPVIAIAREGIFPIDGPRVGQASGAFPTETFPEKAPDTM